MNGLTLSMNAMTLAGQRSAASLGSRSAVAERLCGEHGSAGSRGMHVVCESIFSSRPGRANHFAGAACLTVLPRTAVAGATSSSGRPAVFVVEAKQNSKKRVRQVSCMHDAPGARAGGVLRPAWPFTGGQDASLQQEPQD